MEGDLQGKALWDGGRELVGWGGGYEITDWSSILEPVSLQRNLHAMNTWAYLGVDKCGFTSPQRTLHSSKVYIFSPRLPS